MNEVDAVKDTKLVERIDMALRDSHSDLYADIWKVGLNTALRISDLLSLTFASVEGDTLSIVEKKTGKVREIRINQVVRDVVTRRKQANPNHVFLFQSDANRSRALVKPVSRVAVANAFKEVGERNSIQIKLGTHSMRKTRGYHLFKSGRSLEEVSKILGHSSTSVTMRYIGLDQDMVVKSYSDLEL